ncbi:MAG: hypothetical protein EOM29_10850 [Bacteroidia bacterium]|nr:hypothetical protein [Bacteroidia bacterium]
MFIKELYKAHRFFIRKSQHYVMGNWLEYEREDFFAKSKKENIRLIKYTLYFPIAYVKFMFLMALDIKRGHRLPDYLYNY